MTTYDGRAFLNVCTDTYDVILVDAYQDITIPFQMSSVEFFRQVRDHLKPGGVLVVNMNMHSDKPGSINENLSDTIAAVFPHVQTVEVPGNTNRELFAAETNLFSGFADKAARIEAADLQAMMGRVAAGLTPYESHGYLLTDDRAPVEKLGMAVIDELIQEELKYYKGILETDGVRGLIEAVSG